MKTPPVIVTRKVDDLIPYARNSRTHSDAQVAQIAASVREFGWTKGADLVLDLFGGSGSTMIACEKTGRHARLMELDPKYVDVIVRRWQEFTGKQATHAATGATFAEVEADAGVAVPA